MYSLATKLINSAKLHLVSAKWCSQFESCTLKTVLVNDTVQVFEMVAVGIELPTSIDATNNSVCMVKYFGNILIYNT